MAEVDPLVGRTLAGRWRLEEVLGLGGMGTVYRAVELGVGRPVAVKVLHASMLDNPEMVARFEREAKVMSRLDHPNLVPLLAVEHDGAQHYLVMKYIEGESLSARIRERGRHSVREALPVLAQLGSALDYLHARGIVHRDVKPGNVILSAAGHVTLLDFGISRPMESRLTRAGALIGTPQYMSPEQAIGGEVDHRADLYALGLIAYLLLTGEPPFGRADTFEAIRRTLFETPALASEKSEAVSEALAHVLARALAKEPSARFDSAAEFQHALLDAFAVDSTERSVSNTTRDVTEREESPPTAPALRRVPDAQRVAAAPRPATQPLDAPPRRSAAASVALVVVAVLVLVAVLWRVFR